MRLHPLRRKKAKEESKKKLGQIFKCTFSKLLGCQEIGDRSFYRYPVQFFSSKAFTPATVGAGILGSMDHRSDPVCTGKHALSLGKEKLRESGVTPNSPQANALKGASIRI